MAKSLSLITPVFNEPDIHINLPIIDQELQKTGLSYEIIAINDGSDAVTTTRINSLSIPNLRVYTYASNQGKGFALRYGFEISTGNLICFLDADLQLHPKQIALFTNLMELLDCDVVIGSKRHPLSQVEYGPQRRLYSWVYQQMTKYFFNLSLTDTQVGLKLFKRHVLHHVIPRLSVKKWAFDLELLVVAKHLGFHRIVEAPVNLTWQPGKSNINWKVIPNILQDTLAIFYRKHILRHYNHQKKSSALEEQKVVESFQVETSRSKPLVQRPSISFYNQPQIEQEPTIPLEDDLETSIDRAQLSKIDLLSPEVFEPEIEISEGQKPEVVSPSPTPTRGIIFRAKS